MKRIRNNQKPIGKSITAYGFKNLKKKIHEPKVLSQIFVISEKNTIP